MRSLHCISFGIKQILLKTWWNIHSASMTHLTASLHLSFFSSLQFLPSLPSSSSSPHSHLTPLPYISTAVFPLSPLSSLLSPLPLLFSRCCHANFPGDSVVMDTERQGRSADVWCCSGVCTNRSPVCASFPRRALFVSLQPHNVSPNQEYIDQKMWLLTLRNSQTWFHKVDLDETVTNKFIDPRGNFFTS